MPRRKRMSEEEIRAKLQEAFDGVDADKDGFINYEELKAALVNSGLKPTDGDVAELAKACDESGSGKIDFENFSMSIVETYVKYKINYELRKAFMEMDVDGSGFITKENIKEVCAYYGEEITEEQVNELIASMDQDGSGKISMKEFTDAAMVIIEEKIKAKLEKEAAKELAAAAK